MQSCAAVEIAGAVLMNHEQLVLIYNFYCLEILIKLASQQIDSMLNLYEPKTYIKVTQVLRKCTYQFLKITLKL